MSANADPNNGLQSSTPQNQLSQQPQPLEQQHLETQEARTARVKKSSGEAFLRAADKKNTTVGFRINFLRSKGFSPEEIHACFEAVGQPQTLEFIMNAINEKAPQAQVRPPLPQAPQISPYFSPLPPPQEGYGWKDLFIITTLGSLTCAAAYKAAVAWFPWEVVLRKKGDNVDTEQKRESRRKERSKKEPRGTASENTAPREQGSLVQNDPAADVGATSLLVPPTAAGEKDEEIQKLKAELAEKTEQYTKAMREKVELSVKSAQSKAQQTQAARNLENANKKIAELEAKLDATKPAQNSEIAHEEESTTVVPTTTSELSSQTPEENIPTHPTDATKETIPDGANGEV